MKTLVAFKHSTTHQYPLNISHQHQLCSNVICTASTHIYTQSRDPILHDGIEVMQISGEEQVTLGAASCHCCIPATPQHDCTCFTRPHWRCAAHIEHIWPVHRHAIER